MIKFARRLRNAIHPLNPSKMWGRVFDLSQKQCVSLDGFYLHVLPNDYIGASIIRARNYEPHVTALIRRELHRGETFLDVGGNVGYFTMLASSIVGPEGKVIAFEPNPQNLQLIYESQLKNAFLNQTIYPYAASDHSGILRFTTVGSNGGVVTDSSRDQKHYLLVQSVVIDQVVPDQPINMIKIDIEAHEPFAIRGMENLIKKQRPKIITEFHPWAMRLNNVEAPEEYLAQLENLGYQLGVIHTSKVEKMCRQDLFSYWEGLKQETIHLDLYCDPT